MQEFYIHQNCLSINEGKISIFPDKQKMKEFMLAYPLVKDTRNLSGRKQVTPDSNLNTQTHTHTQRVLVKVIM